MKNQIISGVLGALITALILWLVGAFDKKLTDQQLDSVASRLASDTGFSSRMQRLPASVDVDTKKQVIRLGDLQIVWGKTDAVIAKASDFQKEVHLTFRDSFSEQPVVTLGLSCSRGDTFWSVSESRVATNSYHCRIGGVGTGGWEPDAKTAKETDVHADYVAVGKWR